MGGAMSDLDHVDEIDRVLRGDETERDQLVSDSWRRCIEREVAVKI